MMLQLLIRVVSSVGAFVGAASALVTLELPIPVAISVWLLLGLSAIAVAWDVLEYVRRRPRVYPPKSEEIVRYLAKWLGSGGRAAIFSRDLSWATDPDVLEVLRSKARAGEILAFVARVTPEMSELVKGGAELFEHARPQISLKSRFTVIDYGKAGSRLAIGIVEDGNHVIREYGPSDHVVMALAADLLELAKHTMRKVS